MKYRIKYDRGSSATYPHLVDGDIIELEEVEDCPASDKMTPLEWFTKPNPFLGDVSPYDMIKMGKGDKLCKWIVNQLDENCPASECNGGECECYFLDKDGIHKPKEPKTIQDVTLDDVLIHEMEQNESLEEKFMLDVVKIAKEYYQANPDELFGVSGDELFGVSGFVPIDEVLKVFDVSMADIGCNTKSTWFGGVRKAIKQMKGDK